MNLSPLQLVLIVLSSILLGAVITFSLFNHSDSMLMIGSLLFITALLMVLLLQLRHTGIEQ